MIWQAETQGQLNKNIEIIEPTSGNTGIALVMVAASRSHKITLVMPESMSVERRELMRIRYQFSNPATPAIHELTTGPEVWQATNGKIDILVVGVGTGGTITGISRYIKKCNKSLLSQLRTI